MSADFTAVISNGLASIKSMATGAGGSLDKMASGLTKLGAVGEKEMTKIGAAISKMGGPLGEIGGKFFGAAGMSGGIGKLALVAVAAGVAMKTLSGSIEMARARAQAFMETANSLRQALRSAAQARNDFTAGAVDLGRSQARAESLFGKHAGGEAKYMADEYGLETSDVLGAMSASAPVSKKNRRRVLNIAMEAARSGEMSATEAMTMLSDPAVASAALGQQGGSGISATSRGAAQLIMRRRGAKGPDAYREALDAVGGLGPSRGEVSDINRSSNVVTAAQARAFDSGQTASVMAARSLRAAAPGRKELEEWLRSQNEAILSLLDASKRAGKFAEAWDDLWSLDGTIGKGGFGTQAGDKNQAKIDALREGVPVTGMQGD